MLINEMTEIDQLPIDERRVLMLEGLRLNSWYVSEPDFITQIYRKITSSPDGKFSVISVYHNKIAKSFFPMVSSQVDIYGALNSLGMDFKLVDTESLILDLNSSVQ